MCPIHINPAIRALEEALEASGLVAPLDSVAVANQKVLETAGTVVKVVPVAETFIIGPTVYKAH